MVLYPPPHCLLVGQRTRAQDIWDFALSFTCNEGAEWFLPQKPDMRTGIDPLVNMAGFPYTAVTPGGRRSERSAVYERSFRAATQDGDVLKVWLRAH